MLLSAWLLKLQEEPHGILGKPWVARPRHLAAVEYAETVVQEESRKLVVSPLTHVRLIFRRALLAELHFPLPPLTVLFCSGSRAEISMAPNRPPR